jgi:uncharacterized protein YkwD
MSLEELEEFYRLQRRARTGTFVITLGALGLTAAGISLIPDAPPPTVKPVPATPTKPDVQRFGEATPRLSTNPGETGEPPSAAVELEMLLDAVDALRDHGSPCDEGGLAPLNVSPTLTRAAQQQAIYLDESGVRAHETPGSPVGSTPIDRASGAGFSGSRVLESLAWNKDGPDGAAAWWAQSPEHCPLLMDPDVTHIGVGVSGEVWVALVGE